MSRNAALLVLVALAVGGALGFALGRSSAPPPPPETPPAPEERAEESRRRPARPAEPAPLPSDPDLAVALARFPVPEVESGDGVITGSVRTQEGQPVPGVLVVATRRWLSPRRHQRGERTLEDKVRDTVDHHHFERLTRRETRTGPDGTFRIERLAADGYFLRATRDGWQIFHRRSSGIVRPGESVEYTARREAGVEVLVLGASGVEPAAAEIEATQNGSSTTMTWSPSSRRLSLQPGLWTVRATAKEGALASEGVDVELVAGQPTPKLTLHLRERPGIRGQVTFEDGIATGHIEVAVVLLPPGREADPDLLERSSRKSWIHEHSGYRFAFTDLPPGTYLLGVLQDRKVAASTVLTVDVRAVEHDLVVPAPDPADYVIVRAFGPDGEPAEAQISTAYRDSHRSSSGGGTAARLPDGSYRVHHHDIDPDEVEDDGRFFVRVTSRSYGMKEVAYVPGEDRDVSIRFEAPASLFLTVAGYAGSGFEGLVNVSLAAAGDEVRTSVRGPSPVGGGGLSPEGRLSMKPLVPGSYEVRLSVRVGDHEAIPVASAPIVLSTGENEHTVKLPPLYEVAIEGLPGRSATLRPKDRSWSVWGLDVKDGKLTLRGLPAGAYVVEAQGRRGEGHMEFRVPGPRVLKFAAKPINALLVRIQDETGALARAGFRTGDLVIGVNGKTFESLRQMQGAILAASGDEPPRLLVQRGGRRLEIAIDLRTIFEDREAAGGRMEPASR